MGGEVYDRRPDAGPHESPAGGGEKKPRPKEPRLDRTQCGRATDAGPRPGVGTTPPADDVTYARARGAALTGAEALVAEAPRRRAAPCRRTGAHRCRGPRGRGSAQTRRAVPAAREEVMPARPDQDSIVPATRRARRGHRPVTRGRPTFDVHAGRGVPMPSHPSARRCSRRRMYVRRRDGREGSGTQDPPPYSEDQDQPGLHKLGRNPRPAEPTAGLS